MNEIDEKPFPNPEGKINVLKRYLHILALLQYIPGIPGAEKNETWNAATLADLLSLDELKDSGISDSQVSKYIKGHIVQELGIEVDKKQGGLISTLAEDLDTESQLKIIKVYADFVIKDTSRDIIFKKFIDAMPDRALWTLARIYFAVIEKRLIQFNYVNNAGEKITDWQLCPYYFVLRNNNLYLAAWDSKQKKHILILPDKIKDLTVLEKNKNMEWDIPTIEELFRYSISAYITPGSPVEVKIRYSKNVSATIEGIISILDPATESLENDERFESTFKIIDYQYLCKQLVFYGSDVEILSPPNVRQAMIDMLKKSLSVYEN